MEPGPATGYALKIDSPTAVRTLNALMDEGLTLELALAPFTSAGGGTLPTGSAIFAADAATKVGSPRSAARTTCGSTALVRRHRRPSRSTACRAIMVLTGALNQDVWSLQNLGFTPEFKSTAQLNSAPQDPLPDFDVIWNTGGLADCGTTSPRRGHA